MVTRYDSANSRWRCWGRTYRNGTKKGVIAGHITGPSGDAPYITDLGLPIGMYQTFGLWGNATAMSRFDALKTAVQTSGDLFASGKVHLTGTSAGGLDMLNWAKANPTLVQSINVSIPVIDPQDVYDNNRNGFTADVSAAYGGRPSDANTPAKNAASFVGIPMRIYYSTDDPVTPQSITTTFASAAGAEAISMGAVGHSFDVGIRSSAAVAAWFVSKD